MAVASRIRLALVDSRDARSWFFTTTPTRRSRRCGTPGFGDRALRRRTRPGPTCRTTSDPGRSCSELRTPAASHRGAAAPSGSFASRRSYRCIPCDRGHTELVQQAIGMPLRQLSLIERSESYSHPCHSLQGFAPVARTHMRLVDGSSKSNSTSSGRFSRSWITVVVTPTCAVDPACSSSAHSAGSSGRRAGAATDRAARLGRRGARYRVVAASSRGSARNARRVSATPVWQAARNAIPSAEAMVS